MSEFWDDSDDEDEEVRRQRRREKWHAKLTKYKGDFWAPYYADEMRIENFKLTHFMQERFCIFSSDGSTYHNLAEDRYWTLRNFKLTAKKITEATKKMEEAEQTLIGYVQALEKAKEDATKIREKAEEDAAELIAELASKENELEEKDRVKQQSWGVACANESVILSKRQKYVTQKTQNEHFAKGSF